MGNSVVFLCIIIVIINSCSSFLNDINTEMITSNGVDQTKFGIVYPGTKWCGAGNVANGYNDLGSEEEADRCCRDHDNCPDIIRGGSRKYNLTNRSIFTRLSCACDEALYTCLKSANTPTATIIGNLYFDALGTKCFRKDYPVMCCIKRGGFLNSKCLQYSYDTNGEKVYQYFDVKDF